MNTCANKNNMNCEIRKVLENVLIEIMLMCLGANIKRFLSSSFNENN